MATITGWDTADGIGAEQLRGFFGGGPNPPTPETHRRVLEHGDVVVLAVDADGGRAVGFITAITDDVLAACIPHLEVPPESHRQGIGSALVRRMVERLRQRSLVDLICNEDVRPVDERLRFRPVRGMVLRHDDRQAMVMLLRTRL